MVLGNTLNIHQEFLRRLRQRLHLTEVYDANNCDVIIAFVPTASRAGTDIQAALLNIPNRRNPKVFIINEREIFIDVQNKIMERLKKRHALQQVDSVDMCDVIIAFVPVVSRAGTDIEAALKNIPGRNPKVFIINEREIFIDVQNKIMERLKKSHALQQVDSVDMCDVIIAFVPVVSRAGTDIEAALNNIPELKVSVMVLGNTMNAHTQFINKLRKGAPTLKILDEFSVNECDVFIAFVPIVSRAGTDIQAALNQIYKDKPVVLVVLHHTFEENFIFPGLNNYVNRPDVFMVQCLFYEGQGLLRYPQNDEAIKAVKSHMTKQGDSKNIYIIIRTFGTRRRGGDLNPGMRYRRGLSAKCAQRELSLRARAPGVQRSYTARTTLHDRSIANNALKNHPINTINTGRLINTNGTLRRRNQCTSAKDSEILMCKFIAA
ncbi:hypothetical protein Baya_15471 [Bagarius yarrelli]|uniref:Uncharacterized protein n=1 Tax=Bagarius yarrelli TaxID=175774 RepID=A0A556VC61_BAGYA|nr:hypothetical protein Baya_15471 [Bagarius yarrelli]